MKLRAVFEITTFRARSRRSCRYCCGRASGSAFRRCGEGVAKDIERQLHLSEWCRDLNALDERPHSLEHLARDGDAFSDAMLLRLRAGGAHPLDDRFRHDDSRHLVGQELGVTQGDERPDSGDDWNPRMVDRAKKSFQLLHIEHRLRNRVLRTRFDLPLEPFELVRRIERGRIHADTNREPRWLTDGVAAGIEPAIELADEVGETDRVDIEYRRRIRVRTHLRRVAGDEEYVAESHRRRPEQIAKHAEEIAVAAAVVGDRLDADLLLDEKTCKQRSHATLGARSVRHVHRINAGDA